MITEGADVFLDLMDDSGNLPGDDTYKPDEAEATDEGDSNLEDLLAEEVDDEGDESGEDDTDAVDEDADSDDGADDDDSGDTNDDADKLYDIEIDGETYEVNLPELTSGYLRNEEYVKRSTALEAAHNERVAALEVKEAELLREIEGYAVQGIAELRQYDQLDWNKLKNEDPEGYQSKRLEFLDKRDAVQHQINRRGQIQALQNKAAEIKHQAYLESQRKQVTELLPDFDKPEFQTGLVKFADSIGITEDEVRGIADAKHLLILDMARRFAEGQIKKKEVLNRKVTQDLPEVLKPGGKPRPENTAAKKSKAAHERLRTEQTIDAASAVFAAYL